MTKSKKKEPKTPFDKFYNIFKTLIGTKRKVQITHINPLNKVCTTYEGIISGLSSNCVGMLYNSKIITIPYNLIQSYIILNSD